MWVKSEYAGELAVLSAWLAALVPWNVTYAGSVSVPLGEATLINVRSGLLELQFIWGMPRYSAEGKGTVVEGARESVLGTYGVGGLGLTNEIYLSNPLVTKATIPGAPGSVATAATAAAVGGVFVLLAVLLSLWLYRDERRVESGPVDPVRAMGVLIAGGTVAFAAATYLGWTDGVAGNPIPVGVVVMALLSVSLLTVDRTDEPESDPDSADPDGA